MKILFLKACLMFCSAFVYGQTGDSLKILSNSDWKVEGDWFGKDTVELKPIPKLDTIGLTEIEKKLFVEKEDWGERIAFNANGHLSYSHRLSCPVGELLYDLKEFELGKGIIRTKYKIENWDGDTYLKGETNYKVHKWTIESIVLYKWEK